MAEREGVIKFSLEHDFSTPIPEDFRIASLESWRTLLWQLQLIGQTDERYGGLGFGNVSQRCDMSETSFVITGTQTGHMRHMSLEHYALVISGNVTDNQIASRGKVRPSSEALTHAAIYNACPNVRFVFHAHSPEIWQLATELGLPQTAPDAAYGTTAMAESVSQLLQSPRTKKSRIFAMPGHEDGIVSFGDTAEQAGLPMVLALQRARELSITITPGFEPNL